MRYGLSIAPIPAAIPPSFSFDGFVLRTCPTSSLCMILL